MLRSPGFAASVTTLYLFVYTIIAFSGFSDDLAVVMFLLSPVFVLWMVYTVLRFGTPSTRTFDTHFYDDAPIRSDKLRD